MTQKDVSDYLKDPHIISWIMLVLMIASVLIFFDYFKHYFIRIAFIGILFMMFFWIDDLIFRPVGRSVKDFFSGNLFVKRWKAFPIFLAEIYLIYWLSMLIEQKLGEYLSPDMIKWWYVLVWIGLMFAFYWYKASRD